MKKIRTNIKKRKYLEESTINEKFYDGIWEKNIVRCYPKIKKQKWLGLGGALTEASCYNLLKMSYEKQESLLKDYFTKEGLSYNWGRISIGSNDFCLNSYEYSKQEDLNDFSIERDRKYIIPILKRIKEKQNLTLIASPWSPPSWMKENKNLYNGDKLKQENYALYATYLKLFLESYLKEGIEIDYITMQNEPSASQIWESCQYTLKEQKDFIYNYLIKELNPLNTKIIVWDHNKENLYDVANFLIEKNEKVAGIGFHSYVGTHKTNLNLVAKAFPNQLLIQTEGCCGYSKYKEKKWIKDAEYYLTNLICDMNNGLNASIDWNILLDSKGGPNHKNNVCKSPIVLNKKENDYIKTPLYYYLAHIAKFIKQGATIIPLDLYREDLYGIAALYNNEIIVTLMNKNDYKIEIEVILKNRCHDFLEPHEIVTYIEKS